MMKHRVIHLLSDEDISYLLTGLRVLGHKYVEQGCNEDNALVSMLYDKIENCSDVGVIGHERI